MSTREKWKIVEFSMILHVTKNDEGTIIKKKKKKWKKQIKEDARWQ